MGLPTVSHVFDVSEVLYGTGRLSTGSHGSAGDCIWCSTPLDDESTAKSSERMH